MNPDRKPAAAPTFGVENAIALLKKLPLDDEPELVLRVVRKTLTSIGVSIDEVVRSAKRREDELGDSVGVERRAIEELEREIAARKKTIDERLDWLKETRDMRTRLQEALASESKVGALMIPPEEIKRLQAEGEARAKAGAAEVPKPMPRPSPPPVVAPTPTPTSPPATATATTPSAAPKMTGPPKPPPIKSRIPMPPKRPQSVSAPPTPKPEPEPEKPKDALPSVAADDDDENDPFARPTARWEVEPPRKKSE